MDNEDWNPGYYDKYYKFIPYEKAWYCNTNKLIHKSEKEYKNCIHCQKKFVEILDNKNKVVPLWYNKHGGSST